MGDHTAQQHCADLPWNWVSDILNANCPLEPNIQYGMVDVEKEGKYVQFKIGRANGSEDSSDFCNWGKDV